MKGVSVLTIRLLTKAPVNHFQSRLHTDDKPGGLEEETGNRFKGSEMIMCLDALTSKLARPLPLFVDGNLEAP